MTKSYSFGKEVKKKLIDFDWNMADLAEKISEKTGMFCDVAYLSRILGGQRNPPKIKEAICEILEIKEE